MAKAVAGSSLVSVFVDTGGDSTISTRTLLGDLIELAHGRSVAGASPEQGPFPVARLRELDPDAYLATAGSGVTLKELRARAGVKRLRAVRSGRFAVLPPEATIRGAAGRRRAGAGRADPACRSLG